MTVNKTLLERLNRPGTRHNPLPAPALPASEPALPSQPYLGGAADVLQHATYTPAPGIEARIFATGDDLARDFLGSMPADLREAAIQASQAERTAHQAYRAAEREYQALQRPLDRSIPIDELAARQARAKALEALLPMLEREARAAHEAAYVAVDAARWETRVTTSRPYQDAIRARIRELEHQAAEAAQLASELERALRHALGRVEAWVPPTTDTP